MVELLNLPIIQGSEKDLSKSSLSKDSAITQDSLKIDNLTTGFDWQTWSSIQYRFENPSESSKNISVARKPSRGSESDTKSLRSYKSSKSSKKSNAGKDSKNMCQLMIRGPRGHRKKSDKIRSHSRDNVSRLIFGILVRRFKGTVNLLEWFVSLFEWLFEFFEY